MKKEYVDQTHGVAGVETPAFVERASGQVLVYKSTTVSPGLRPRPSLSGLNTLLQIE